MINLITLEMKKIDNNFDFPEYINFINEDERIKLLKETNQFYIVDDFFDAHGLTCEAIRKVSMIDLATVIGVFKNIEIKMGKCYITFEPKGRLSENFLEEFNNNLKDFYLVPRGIWDSEKREIKHITCFVLKYKTK